MFFVLFDGFLINEFLLNRQEGWINCVVLDKVWCWIGCDLMLIDVCMVLEQVGNVVVSGDCVDLLVQVLWICLVDVIGVVLDFVEIDEKQCC